MSKKRDILAYCNMCRNYTNHNILFEKEQGYTGENEDINSTFKYRMVDCLWCGDISFQEEVIDHNQGFPDEDGEWENVGILTRYPPVLKDHRIIENWWLLPDTIELIYKESINAFKANCKLLAWAWFRGVIEAVCTDKEIKGRTLEERINNLAKEGLITKKECHRLHSIRFLGNDSIHEIMPPKTEQLELVLNIIEHILENIYVIDSQVEVKLEGPINSYAIFIKKLNGKLKDIAAWEENPLAHFFWRDIRRIKDNFIEFEGQLIEEIAKGSYTKLALGKKQSYQNSKWNLQYFRVIETNN